MVRSRRQTRFALVGGALAIALAACTTCPTTTTISEGVAVVRLSSPVPTTIPLGTVLVEDYDWNVPESPQIDMWGHGDWNSPEFTIMWPPWMIEQQGATKITIHRADGTHLARPMTVDRLFAVAESGTFWLEVESFGPWTLWITEGASKK